MPLPALFLASLLAAPAPAPTAGQASTPGPLLLDAPANKTVVRGDPAELPLRVAAGQEHMTSLRIEIDGKPGGFVLPWTESITLEPGLHRVRVHGYDARSGAPVSSELMQIAVFEEASRPPLHPRERNAWTALIAFVLAVSSATALRRRGQL